MKRTIAALAAALLGAVSLLFGATPAQAYASCASGDICFYDGYAGAGTILFNHDADDRPGCTALPSGARNRMSSVDNINSPSHDIRVYSQSASCSGLSTLIYANTQGNMAGQWDNSIDSYYVY